MSIALTIIGAVGATFAFNRILGDVQKDATIQIQKNATELTKTINQKLNDEFSDPKLKARVDELAKSLTAAELVVPVSAALTDQLFVRKDKPYAVENQQVHGWFLHMNEDHTISSFQNLAAHPGNWVIRNAF